MVPYKIKREYAPTIYNVAKRVYDKEIKLVKGQDELNYKCNGMNESSAADFIYSFKKMLEGKMHQRTINSDIRDYMLECIYKEYGREKLRIALGAFMKHIEYYEDIKEGTQIKDRQLYEKYQILLDEQNEKEQECVLKIFENRESKAAIIERLKNYETKESQLIEINGLSFSRDNTIIALLKKLRDFKCQICGVSIKKSDGSFYIEGAHIIPKYKGGKESIENILILCPNHHKEFDFGKPKILEHNEDEVKFNLNDKEYNIILKLPEV